jgi:hypothetical protein
MPSHRLQDGSLSTLLPAFRALRPTGAELPLDRADQGTATVE